MTPTGLNESNGDHESPVDPRVDGRHRSWPDYRTLWRWHFFAGVACMPLIVLLAVTGSIYLFRPQIEAWQQSGYDATSRSGPPLAYDIQVQRTLLQIDDAQFVSLELLRNDPVPSATRMVIAVAGVNHTVWVDPVDGKVIDRVESNHTFLRKVRRLHGELMLGKRGSSWNGINQAAAMLATIALVGLSGSGAVLWWRRGQAFRLAPPEVRSSQFTISRPRQIAVIAVILALAIYLPLFGVSLVIVRLADSIGKRVRGPRTASMIMLMMAIACATSIGGCGSSQGPITGGTVGTIQSGGIPLSQIQVTIHESSGTAFEPRAVGMVRPDGSFELVTPDASAPVTLEDGDYVVTIESLGAEIEIPASLLDPGPESLIHHHINGQPLDVGLPLLPGMK